MARIRWPAAHPPLDIDFSTSSGRSRRINFAGLALLVGGLFATAVATLEVAALRERAEAAERRLASLRKAVARPVRATAPAVSPEDGAAAWRIADAVNQPWAALLRDLEGAARPEVALLAFEADARSGRSLRLKGEAATADDAFAYVRRLGESSSIASATLVSHEDVSVGQRQLFAFTIAVTWKGAA